MIALIFYIGAAFGLAYVVGHSAISKPFREAIATGGIGVEFAIRNFIVDLLECPACFGFWTGVIAAALGWFPIPGSIFAAGFFTAALNLIIAKSIKLID